MYPVHMPDRRMFFQINWGLVLTTMLLFAVGMVNLYSASGARVEGGFVLSPFFHKQLVWGLIGLGAMAVCAVVDYRRIERMAVPCFIVVLILLMLVPLIGKKLLGGMKSMEQRDAKWTDILSGSMFIGMIAAFLGFVFCDVGMLWAPVEGIAPTTGLIPVAVMGVSAAVMVGLGLAMKKWKWLGDYALPISLVIGMISAIPITAWLG